MDPKLMLWVKVGLAGLGIVSVTVLAGLGKIEGTAAVDFSKWVLMTLMGGAALLGVAGALAPSPGPITARKAPPLSPPPPAP